MPSAPVDPASSDTRSPAPERGAAADARASDGARGLPPSGWVASTYFAQGLPYSLVHQVAPQVFTALKVPFSQIGLTSLYHGAWLLKFAWSPLVDRTMTMRRWIVVCEIALAVATLGIALPAARGDTRAMAWALVVLSVLAATHDVAIDGFYLRGLDRARQTSLSGLRVAAYRAALLVGNGALVAIGGLIGFGPVFVIAAALLLALALGHAWLLPSPVDATGEGATAHDDAAAAAARPRLVEAVASFLAQPKALCVVALIVVFKAGDAMMFAMSTPFLRDLGLGTSARGVLGGFGIAASVLGSMLGAAFIARRGLRATLFPIAAAQSAAILLYVVLAKGRLGFAAIYATVLVEQLVAGVGTAAFVVFLTRRCAPEHRASHFAIATSLMQLATMGAGAASGYVAEWLGFPGLFALAFAASLPGVALARSVPTE